MADDGQNKKPIAAYVPFRTFLNAIERLEHGVPNVIDRTVWPTFSGLYQSQTLGTFRFLGLIDQNGKPTPDLQKLVEDKGNRKQHLRRILEQSYAGLIKGDLTKMTPASFNAAMESYGATGDTHRKVISFFLQAAKFSGLPISPYVLKATRAPRKRKVQNPSPKGQYVGDIKGIADNGSSQQNGPMKTIQLRSGATLTISSSSDMFSMTSEDRAFVMKILEEIEAYESEASTDENAS